MFLLPQKANAMARKAFCIIFLHTDPPPHIECTAGTFGQKIIISFFVLFLDFNEALGYYVRNLWL